THVVVDQLYANPDSPAADADQPITYRPQSRGSTLYSLPRTAPQLPQRAGTCLVRFPSHPQLRPAEHVAITARNPFTRFQTRL
ncbi:hypothetical protein, partial [Salmonella enterica]|uniref:hypothetical protein n=1 Tax=Salmonella enterica TaxID=28901 RepID=UPI00398C273D